MAVSAARIARRIFVLIAFSIVSPVRDLRIDFYDEFRCVHASSAYENSPKVEIGDFV